MADNSPGKQHSDSQPVLVMGIGNLLMGDEGAGIHAVKMLEKVKLSRPVDIVDGGCGGFTLMSYLLDYPEVVMIDAAMDGNPPGTISILEPVFAADFPRNLTAHDFGLRDLIESVSLVGKLPKIYLITISIPDICKMSMKLSQPLKESLPAVIDSVKHVLETKFLPCTLVN